MLPLPGDIKQKVRKPRESLIERKVCRYARSKGLRADKWTSPGRRSVPDRIILGPERLIFFIEFKRPGEKPTKLQEAEHAELRKLGFSVFVIDNVEDGIALIDKYA